MRTTAVLMIGLAIGQAATADDHPAKAILDRQVADWNRKDLDGFCEGYWKSPKLIFQSGGDRVEGWEPMRDRYRRRYQGEGRAMGTLAFKEVEIEGLGPDSAFARGRWELQFADPKAPSPKVGGRFTLILRKLPEGWRIVHDHTSVDAPAAKP